MTCPNARRSRRLESVEIQASGLVRCTGMSCIDALERVLDERNIRLGNGEFGRLLEAMEERIILTRHILDSVVDEDEDFEEDYQINGGGV